MEPQNTLLGLGRLLIALIFLFLLSIIISSCASVDIVIRPDPNPSPMDVNYHNLWMDASCDNNPNKVGIAACSFSHNEDLSKHTLKVVSPLGGIVEVIGRECGYKNRFKIDQGEILSFNVSDIVPPLTDFCRFTFTTFWDKPDSINTELPLRGQRGKFYVRIRDPESDPAKIVFFPGEVHEFTGIAGAQFMEFVDGGPTVLEPILLKILLTQVVDKGIYQIWSEQHQIGLKSKEFSGNEIQIPRDSIIKKNFKGSYAMAGWAVSSGMQTLKFDNDFVLAIDIYGKNNHTLAGKVTVSDNEICYKVENTVSLVLMSGVNKASNDVEGCFDRPEGDSMLAAYTHVGRVGYAVIKSDGTYIWRQ